MEFGRPTQPSGIQFDRPLRRRKMRSGVTAAVAVALLCASCDDGTTEANAEAAATTRGRQSGDNRRSGNDSPGTAELLD